MRNLRAVSFVETIVDSALPLTATAWDTNDGSMICAFGPTETSPTIELKRRVTDDNPQIVNGQYSTTKLVPITSWDAPCPLPSLPCDEIILLHYFPDTATVCIVLAGGDLVLVRLEAEDDQEAIEIVGSIDAGILAAAWAPDEELLAIVTRDDNLVLMSRNLEPLTEARLTADDLQASRHVSVGWGKKETQFQGKRAKAMRDPTMPEHIDEGQLSPYDDGSASVSWRGDGEYVALNSVVRGHRRVIRVFSREGVLDSVSEPVDGMESALTWKPSGNLIATIKRIGDSKLEVIFFERNGLRHGDFPLRLKPPDDNSKARHIKLAWNRDSTVLAVSFLDSVQFWTMGNYHYYLKQDLSLGLQKKPIDVRWHSERALKCCLRTPQKMLELEYTLQVCRGSTVSPYDYGIVAVIDGSTLKLTPLKHAGVPPPMAFCETDAGSNIIDCSINRSGDCIAVLTQSHLRLFKWKMQDTKKMSSNKNQRHSTQLQSFDIPMKHIDNQYARRLGLKVCFGKDRELYVLSPAQGASVAQCRKIMLTENAAHEWDGDYNHMLEAVCSVTVSYTAHNLLMDIGHQSAWFQDGSSTTLLSSEVNSQDPAITFVTGQPNTLISASRSDFQDDYNPPHQQFYMTASGILHAGERMLVRDCTSFVLTETHIIITTSQHLLKFIHLDNQNRLEIPGDTPEVDERCRTVERGARLVTVIPSIYAVVLQMPRGNLETIYPRVLVLSGIRQCLKVQEYRTAFLACQNHQVDMNILYDHLPDVFLANIPKVISQLEKPSRIDEFLSKLKEEDVTKTLYRDTLKALGDDDSHVAYTNGTTTTASKSTYYTGADKVNNICESFITTMNLQPSKYLQNIISAHVCKKPPDLKAALTLVSSLRQDSPDEADSAIAHLCFLTDANRLYDAALALYDLELTLLVAQNAQRDPREYMPFLQNLQNMPPLRRQYTIDNHLRKYATALESLHALEAHDEVEAYTNKHLLYTAAMDLYKYDSDHLSKIATFYAEYLESQSQYASAAMLYESLNDFTSAYPLYALAHQWRESLSCASLVPLEAEKLRNHATSLATTCADESRDYRAAATIHIEYLSDIPHAAQLLCKGSYFAEATRILSLHNLSTQLTTIIDPGLLEKFSEILELVADCKSQLAAQIPRIKDLRLKKEEDPLAFYGGDASAAAADGIDIPDNISLAPTDTSTIGGQSLFTRYGSNASKFGGTVASNVSRKTSKTKRREERKRARGKKGSVYEEEYLVSSVARLIERVNGVQEEVKRLVSGLLRRGMREQSGKVDEVMREMSALCERAKGEVWNVEGKEIDYSSSAQVGIGSGGGGTAVGGSSNGNYDVNGEGRPGGADGVFWDAQQEVNSISKKEAPEVKVWVGNPLVLR